MGRETKQKILQEMIDIDYISGAELINSRDVLSKYDLLVDNRLASKLVYTEGLYKEIAHMRIGALFMIKYNPSLKKRLMSEEKINELGYMNKITDIPELVKIRKYLFDNGLYYAHLSDDNYMVMDIADSSADNPYRKKVSIYFIGKKHKKWFNKYYKFYHKYYDLSDSDIQNAFINKNGDKRRETTRFKKFSSMVFPEKENLLKYIDNFIENIPTYYNYGMTPKLSILLYGKYGTGKSTTCQALAEYMKIPGIYYIHANDFQVTRSDRDNQQQSMQYNSPDTEDGLCAIRCIDDIDCICNSRDDDNSMENKAALQSLLAYLDSPGTFYYETKDGNYYPISVIVATTNYYDKLDPAVRRHGRFDLQIELKDLDMNGAIEMCGLYDLTPEYVLGDEYKPTKSFRVSPAYLQAKCMEKVDGRLKSQKIKEKEPVPKKKPTNATLGDKDTKHPDFPKKKKKKDKSKKKKKGKKKHD